MEIFTRILFDKGCDFSLAVRKVIDPFEILCIIMRQAIIMLLLAYAQRERERQRDLSLIHI